MELIMIATLITSLSLLPFAAGAASAVCPNSTIEAAEGSDATLPCHLDPQENVVDLTIDWKKKGHKRVVLSYRYGKQNHEDQSPEFRGTRTTLNGDLSRGNLSLLISSVNLSHSGSYRCFVPRLKLFCFTVLAVVPRDQQNRTERLDSSTSVAPVEEEPESADQDAVWKILRVVVVVAVLVVLLLLLWKRVGDQGDVHRNEEDDDVARC